MTCSLFAVTFDAHDPRCLGRFWGGLLGWDTVADHHDGFALLPPDDDGGYRLRFTPSEQPKQGQNRGHFDLTSASPDDQRETVAKALALGARHLDIGQGPDARHVVLADPEDNEFCVIEAGNNFLAGCGPLGALACDGSQQVGYFWSGALAWPLVWDQDQETAIQSPHGGTKITWGGPPIAPKVGKNRVHLDLVADAGSDHRTEVARLVGLGATPVDIGQGEVDWAVLADPDGNEFCLLPRTSVPTHT